MSAMLKTPVFALLTLLSAIVAILAQTGLALSPPWGFVAKPLTTLLIIAWAWPRGRDNPVTRRWMIVGLWASLGGDIALLWPEQGFIFGLLSFLVAHLAYLWAFTRVARLAAWPLPFVGYALLAAGLLSQLWHGVPAELRAPVIVYVLALTVMGAQAAVVGWRARGTPAAGRSALLALGGLLFVISDACIAFNKFDGPVPLASLWILSLYWLAQWFIAGWLAPRGGAR